MVNIHEKDGVFTLEGTSFDLKIDNNREIYIKKKSDSKFIGINSQIEKGYTSDEKKKYLYNLYVEINNKLPTQ